jgi:hypothetical protein
LFYPCLHHHRFSSFCSLSLLAATKAVVQLWDMWCLSKLELGQKFW